MLTVSCSATHSRTLKASGTLYDIILQLQLTSNIISASTQKEVLFSIFKIAYLIAHGRATSIKSSTYKDIPISRGNRKII